VSKRTTLTLEEDVVEALQTKARISGKPIKEVVNQAIRDGLAAQTTKADDTDAFVVDARPLKLRAGLSYDNVGDLLEYVEGPEHR
jgi:predicted transcriptional regulator